MIGAGLRAAREFGKLIYPSFDEDETRVLLTKEYLLYMVSEIDEVLRETATWKTHRKQHGVVVRDNLLEEIVDLFKFWLGVAALWGFTEADIAREYHRKTEVVLQRYQQERALAETTKPIVIVDIDGVLADYPAAFYRFVERSTGQVPFRASGVELARLKREYRSLGFEGAFVNVRQGARTFVDGLRAKGHFVLALTSRPYGQYKRLFSDTWSWLVDNGIAPDAVAFEEDKAEFVLRLLDEGKNIALFVDDDSRYVDKVAALRVPTYWMQDGCWPGEASNA